jgi:3-phosphoshikimate 1-carboxyvinyltransferase
MTESIEIQPATVSGTIQPPGSKSITNRALVCASLADGTSHLTGVLDSDDTRVMIESLRRLGIAIEAELPCATLDVTGCGGRLPGSGADLFVGNSGTTVRFLTAMVALGHGTYRLDGVPRMRQRPIQDLIDALQHLGVDIRSDYGTGCPPVTIVAQGLRGGTVPMRGDTSSQFLSALLMAAPYAEQPVTIELVGPLVSQPYVRMTCRVMEAFGARVDVEAGERRLNVARGAFEAVHYAIEPDASAASYFWAAAAITGGCVRVVGLSRNALQGDVAFCDCLMKMGCQVDYGADYIEVTGGPLRGIDINMNAISDTVQSLGAVALFADGPTRISGVAHIRHKETDRIGDLARELRKFGARVDENADGLTIDPGPLRAAVVETYDDHRMAMSLALPGLRIPGVVVTNPACTAKTYPHFFADLNRLRT